MKKLLQDKTYVANLLVGVAVLFTAGQMSATAQQGEPSSPGAQIIEPEGEVSSEFVTINVKDANISEVLKAYSLQTGQSIVVGPDVVSDNVNVRLNNIPWQDALDVILKPYGFGYRVVGDTIVISRLENIVTVEGIEPLSSKVFKLKYLDAYDVKEVCEAQLSGRGKFTILSTKGLPGWEFGGSGESGRSTSSGGVRQRSIKDEVLKSKTFVITDVPSSLSAIDAMVEEMDTVPGQVLIEARFMEVDVDNLSDIGLEFLTIIESVAGPVLADSISPLVDGGGNVLNPVEAITDPIDAGASGMFNQDQGLRITSSRLGELGIDALFRLQDDTGDINILSSPRILTLDNQEASMLVGTKYPIIESDVTGGNVANTSVSLDYYENIGIQLNVLPQISDNDFINMIVHPVVSEIQGFTDGSVQSQTTGDSTSTQYPILNVREAETQILLKSGETAVIGGLETQRDSFDVQKVPLIGDLPYLGRLFRREIKTVKKIDLLIFIKAGIIDREAYVADSLVQQKAQAESMELINKKETAEPMENASLEEEAPDSEEEAAPAAPESIDAVESEVVEPVEAAEMDALIAETSTVEVVDLETFNELGATNSNTDGEEIVSFVQQMDAAPVEEAGQPEQM